jgi:hypothetical protein
LWEQGPPFATLPIALEEALARAEATRTNKLLLWGERVSGISSYLAGWMAGGGIDVIVLDGANGFDPYTVSSFARRALIPPERLLKRIQIARAFTCYQMATLVERLASLLRQRETPQTESFPSPFQCLSARRQGQGGRGAVKVILLGPITTFLDEDVPEREVEPLFERSLRKVERMAEAGVPFFLFQSYASSQNHSGREVGKRSPFNKGTAQGSVGSKRAHLMKRLFQFSNLTWRVSLKEEGPKLILEKGPMENIRDQIAD